MANKTLEYRDGAVTLKGYLADDGKRVRGRAWCCSRKPSVSAIT
jgi:hypothetical protein